ncbi:GH116 family glycosyl-hydrolase [Chitinophaga solisilvae]|uniref:GH116 family glycosyl-hydrolase n=1 Tax=Chitinophaga solisilvae TaxID=1233460 RepID=UPI00136AEF8A|nr:GH116 family glycosyl-hydrolase [Chitinophaga solisilvae]
MTMQRRKFIRNAGLSMAGIISLRLPAAGISRWVSSLQPDAAWINSLYERGKVTTYLKSRNELQYIGMPVGGIGCGTVYLGGDGRLWLWDIFNKNQEGIEPKVVSWNAEVLDGGKKVRSRDGACYIAPSKDIRPLDQGFALQLTYGNTTIIRPFDEASWPEISFEATYPMATIRYSDPSLPVAVTLEAFSPFIPLNEDDSGLPVTLLSWQIKNTGKVPVTAAVIGWLENKTALYNAVAARHERVNTVTAGKGWKGVQLSARTIGGDNSHFAQQHDFGNMCLAALDNTAVTVTDMPPGPLTAATFRSAVTKQAVKGITDKLQAAVTTVHRILPGKDIRTTFAVSWYFPNLRFKDIQGEGRYYTNKFSDAAAVMGYVQQHYARLSAESRLWKDTWYDSVLPWWFMERTFLNISTLATTTAHRFTSGRFYAWEGVGACEGTCTHVWQYAQAVGRIFPALERDTRQRVDLGIAQQPDGGILFRGEAEKRPAIDGQAGTVLRIYREHQMSTDSSFLQHNWPQIKKATQFIINQDRNGDGMEDTPMENTLDAIWDGEIAWIVGLCIAAVKAGELMAIEMKDDDFAAACKLYADKGRRNMETQLYNGEYFIHQPDKIKGRSVIGSYNTCHIDQVYGQSWAFQVGMDRVLDKEKTLSALHALWKYNYMADVGPYIAKHPGGRPYALPGEGGMILNTNPRREEFPFGVKNAWQLGYFNECMSGFEHQVASHMMAEGMVTEALTLTRAVHDRYHAFKRNPFNEIECSDHYARAMASYGTFVTACGFEYHGPKGHIGFAPAMRADQFRAPFVTAAGWGVYSQHLTGSRQQHVLTLKYGNLTVQTLKFRKAQPATITVTADGRQLPATFSATDGCVHIQLAAPVKIQAGQSLNISIA